MHEPVASMLHQDPTSIWSFSNAAETDPAKILEIIIQFLEESELSGEQVVKGLLSAICIKTRQHHVYIAEVEV